MRVHGTDDGESSKPGYGRTPPVQGPAGKLRQRESSPAFTIVDFLDGALATCLVALFGLQLEADSFSPRRNRAESSQRRRGPPRVRLRPRCRPRRRCERERGPRPPSGPLVRRLHQGQSGNPFLPSDMSFLNIMPRLLVVHLSSIVRCSPFFRRSSSFQHSCLFPLPIIITRLPPQTTPHCSETANGCRPNES